MEKINRRMEEKDISRKEKEENEGEATRSAINASGDSGTNVEKISRWMEEKDISRKEKEKNDGEATRSAINNSGTVTHKKLNVIVKCMGYKYHGFVDWMIAIIASFTFTQ
ncbi:uncharacterized protein LOC117282968 [Cryptotermes secundus]|uniref:uncharacterized protein LOC117282968 n=1 Tax=Cryptotermes secundus TaxID=105785 RepID=UPI001454DD06|nr:uncharacterized protein LOC117282968 [Cryptotermes secundus]